MSMEIWVRIGKPEQAAVEVAPVSAAGIKEGCSDRLFCRDQNSKINFLIDTGADVSIIPATDLSNPKEYTLYAANGTLLKLMDLRF
jgi:Retroviral aspartyl protease